MPSHIKTEHMERMFPFAFYEELHEQLHGYTLNNPAYLLSRLKGDVTKDERYAFYSASRAKELLETIHSQNLIEADPFGELLILDMVCKDEDVPRLVTKSDDRYTVPLSLLVCQLYDSSDAPVFAKDVSEETIATIPEVLWDDPNLLLAIVSFGEDESTVGILKAPERLEARWFEEKEADDTSV